MRTYIDETGNLAGDLLTPECVADCTVPGADASAAVQHWREVLDFTVPKEAAIEYLAGFGAWDRSEMSAWPPERIAETVLWVLCCNEREAAGMSEHGINL